MNPEWFYSDGDIRKGPVTLDELKRLYDDGLLKPTDLVWREGMPDWVEVRTITELVNGPGVTIDRNRSKRDRRDDDDDDVRERRRRYVDDDDDRPKPRRRNRDDDDVYSDYDDNPRPRSGGQKPSQVQTVGVLLLVGGIMGLLVTASIVLGSMFFCCLWPGTYFELIWSIFAIMRGTNMMNQDDQGSAKTLAILQIICIINGDLLNCVLGIIAVIMLGDPQVQAYYRRKGWA